MLTVLFLAEKINRQKLFFKSASLHFSHAWKICILEKQATEVILVGWFGKCQSIKKVGGRRFVEGLYQALFSFRHARRNVIYTKKRNENRAWSQVINMILLKTSKTKYWIRHHQTACLQQDYCFATAFFPAPVFLRIQFETCSAACLYSVVVIAVVWRGLPWEIASNFFKNPGLGL